MNYPPPTAPSPAAGRNRRAGRKSDPGRSRRSKGRKPAGRRRLNLTWWQGAILALMAAGVVIAAVSLSRGRQSILRLERQRQEDFQKYQKEVRAHQVKYRDEIVYYATLYGVDPAYVAAIIKRESDYDPRAVSRVGAMGLMQMMPDTFDWVRKNTGYRDAQIDILFQPEPAIKMGCYLLRYIIDTMQTDDPILVACAYHAGWGNVNSWLKKYSTDGKTLTLSQIPKDDTRYYAGKVLNAYAIYQQHYY